jgi:hypothetical protein
MTSIATLQPRCWFGGWVITRHEWVFDKRGDRDEDFEVVDPQVYRTEAEALAAIELMRGRA